MSLGVALGHLLPDERLATAARWTGRALRIAWHLQDRPLLGLVLRMHGNELRKAGHPAAGITRLRQALQVDDIRYDRAPDWSCWPVRQPSPGRPTCSTPPPASASRR